MLLRFPDFEDRDTIHHFDPELVDVATETERAGQPMLIVWLSSGLELRLYDRKREGVKRINAARTLGIDDDGEEEAGKPILPIAPAPRR